MKRVLFPLVSLLFLVSCTDQMQEGSLALRYDKPADFFEESLVIGNGTLGAIVYGGVEQNRIALNDITLWTGEPEGEPYTPDAYKALDEVRGYLDAEDYAAAEQANKQIQGHNSQYYQPLGTLFLNSDQNEFSDYERYLDISRSIASDSFTTGSGSFVREYFASAPDSVIVIRLSAKEGRINTTLAYDCKLPHETEIMSGEGNVGEIVTTGYAAYGYDHTRDGSLDAFLYDPDRGIHFRTIVHVIAKDGSVRESEGGISLSDCTEALVLVSNVTSFNGPLNDPVKAGRDYKTDVEARIANAAGKSFESLKKAHVKDYRSFFDRVGLDLGATAPEIAALTTDQQLKLYGDESQVNPDLEELYFQYGRYLLISCSRSSTVPANLQGLWNESLTPPWRSNYTVNINLEENYWPAEPGNLGEMHGTLLNFIENLSVNGKASAANYYGVQEGWCSGHNSDVWAMTNPVGLRNGNPQWACWTMGGAWLSTHLWEHYAFSMDKEYLARVYPILKGAALFCLDWLIEKDGFLMTSPATSPEAMFIAPGGVAVATLYGGTADLAFTRECLIDTREAAKVLGTDEELCERIDSTLSHLLPYRIGSRGNLQEWYHDWDDQEWTHRHQSHLFGLYPGHHISVEKTPELADACARTLEIKGDRTTGWSTGWRVNLQARLKEAEKAYHIYRVLLTYISPDAYRGEDARRGGGTYPNLLDAHSPFQIDGNFGGCAGVMEMLVQSTLEEGVVLLPALPEAWRAEGLLRGVRVRGGFELDFGWADGKLSSLKVKSVRKDSGSLHIVCGDKSYDVDLNAGESRKVKV